MSRGRPPKGAQLVDGLESSAQARERLKVILQTIAGELSVVDACGKLNIGEARFHEMRTEVLEAALRNLEPQPLGRPPAPPPTEQEKRIQQLEAQVTELKIDLRAAQIREELALVMPHVLKPRKDQPLDRGARLDEMQDEEEKKGAKKGTITYPTLPYNDVKDSTPPGSCESGKSST